MMFLVYWKKNCKQNLDSYCPESADLKYIQFFMHFDNTKGTKIRSKTSVKVFCCCYAPQLRQKFRPKPNKRSYFWNQHIKEIFKQCLVDSFLPWENIRYF